MTDTPLHIEVIGGHYPDSYVYTGSGDDVVFLCELNAPKWRNAVAFTPENARKLAAALNKMADNAEDAAPPPADTRLATAEDVIAGTARYRDTPGGHADRRTLKREGLT